MRALEGTYYDGQSSRAVPVRLEAGPDGLLRLEGAETTLEVAAAECRLSEPLGRMARHITLPDGGRIEVTDLAALAEWEGVLGHDRLLRAVHHIEGRWRWVAAACSFLLLVLMVLYVWGLPLAAKWAAFKMPPAVAATASAQAMDLISRMLRFEESQLPAARREAINAEFQRMAAAMHRGPPRDYRLRFFDSKIPNAFALPDGLVCITDKLVEMAKNDQEVFGVLAHEIVHVREQHGMRGALQNSAVFLLWTLMTGDVSTLAGMGSALPAVLAQSGYSRGFEQEADLGAADHLIQRGWGVAPLSAILRRIDPEVGGGGILDATEAISSHPATARRIRLLQEHEKKTAR